MELLQDIPWLIQQQASFIADHQLSSGAIPWSQDSIITPWEHVECAIALDLSGRFHQATKAYMWLRDVQNPDGSWWSSYVNGRPKDLIKDANYSSYIAVGLWCHYLATGDIDSLSQMWPSVESGILFALHLQQPGGEIYWACDASDAVHPVALLAASSCTLLSIRCGIRIAKLLGQHKPDWNAASAKLARAIKECPEVFDDPGGDKYNYAMSWYYPVLTGVIKGKEAKRRILSRWSDFVIDDWGCKCVIEAPWWVTTAETCELTLALMRIDERDKAKLLLNWLVKLQDHDGSFWTGMKLPEEQIWPEEKPTWASAAMILAAVAQLRDNKGASYKL